MTLISVPSVPSVLATPVVSAYPFCPVLSKPHCCLASGSLIVFRSNVSVSVIVVEAVTAVIPVPMVAVITAVCPDNAEGAGVTRPVFVPTVATAGFPLVQLTFEVIFWVLPSKYVPVAVS